jgi:hypothetical protein
MTFQMNSKVLGLVLFLIVNVFINIEANAQDVRY